MLIGNDLYHDLMLPRKIELQPGLHLQESRLGWILSGRTNCSVTGNSLTHSLTNSARADDAATEISLLSVGSFPSLSAQGTDSSDHVETFWQLESMGITDSATIPDDANTQAQFEQSISFADGCYLLSWPWKNVNLPINFNSAKAHLKSLLRHLRKTPDLLQHYHGII